MRRIICYDVFGTSFSLDNVSRAIERFYGSELARANYSARAVTNDIFWTGQRDFAYLSTIGQYTPIGSIFRAVMRRQLLIAFETLSVPPAIPEDQLDTIFSCFKALSPRPGYLDCLRAFKQQGFENYAVSNGATQNTANLFREALAATSETSNFDLLDELGLKIYSCDEVKKAKPDLAIYNHVLKQTGVTAEDEKWFVAAHAWDLAAAKKAGFMTAYISFEEFDACEKLFGKPDLIVKSFDELREALRK